MAIALGVFIQKLFSDISEKYLFEGFKLTLIIFIIFGWLSILIPNSKIYFGFGDFNNPVFPFAEPSYYALCVLSISIPVIIKLNIKFKILLISNFILQALYFPSLTLILCTLFLIALVLRGHMKKFLLIILIAVLSILIFGELVGENYFFSRLDLSAGSTNISSLTYLQGWHEIFKALQDTSGFGLGYRQMGTNSQTEVGLMLDSYGFSDLGRKDGSFLFSRIASEFGVLGILLVCLYIFWLIFIWSKISKLNGEQDYKILFTYFIALSSLIELFIRGGNYLSSTLILSVASACYLYKMTRKCL
ncbi:hypothetical protein [Polynucleobacter nymphae]|uniref:hypothetical protein n=1 Tax=Polynucleobacter nymphae TaxID=2081043 RepID=UPI001C0DCC5A|nr:hypothetical protein [Polynucleobacter nymphae]